MRSKRQSAGWVRGSITPEVLVHLGVARGPNGHGNVLTTCIDGATAEAWVRIVALALVLLDLLLGRPPLSCFRTKGRRSLAILTMAHY